MDNVQLIAVQTQRVLQRRLDAVANNLANVNTTGFKADSVLTEVDTPDPAHSLDAPTDVRFVRDALTIHDHSQGSLQMTGEPFDLAIQGEGFFTVRGPDGPLYTRDGAFTLDATGQLVTKDGRAVLSDGGAPIAIDLQRGQPTIGVDGAIRVNGEEAGRIGIATFANVAALKKFGDNLWSGANAQPNPTAVLVQGAVENSNVNAVLELTNLIEISRAYESAAKFAINTDDLRQRAVQRLGGLA
jgi:flagellar basal-body rod protein FlgF